MKTLEEIMDKLKASVEPEIDRCIENDGRLYGVVYDEHILCTADTLGYCPLRSPYKTYMGFRSCYLLKDEEDGT